MPDKIKKETATKDVGFDCLMFHRLWRIVRIIFPKFLSIPSALFFSLLSVAVLEQVLVFNVGLIPSRFFKVLIAKNWDGFITTTLTSLALVLAIALVLSIKEYVRNMLYVNWRLILCKYLHSHYFSGINYYMLNVLDTRTDNPDQRMSQDVDRLCDSLSKITSQIILSPFLIGYYTYSTYIRTGWIGPVSIYALFVVSTIVNKLLMSMIVPFVVNQEKCEGDFRFCHMLVRVNSESIAFNVSSKVESKKTNESLMSLASSQMSLFNRQILLNLSRYCFNYLGSILSYLAIAVPVFSGALDDSNDMAGQISAFSFVCMYLVFTLTTLVDLTNQVVLLSGVTHRVAELAEVLNRLQLEWQMSSLQTASSFSNITQHRKSSSPFVCLTPADSRWLLSDPLEELEIVDQCIDAPIAIFQDVTIKSPNQEAILVKDLNLEIHKGQNILIMGSSSSGKSSILRVLRGLWSVAEGTVAHDWPPGPNFVVFLPQKPLLTAGSLLEQITYPLEMSSELSPVTDEQLQELLCLFDELNMSTLVERCEGLTTSHKWNWYDILSPGEMQRLCFLRLIFHRPEFAFLDEATSALSGDIEDKLYGLCIERGITLISVGHRESLMKYHDLLLMLEGEGGWKLGPIRETGKPDPIGNASVGGVDLEGLMKESIGNQDGMGEGSDISNILKEGEFGESVEIVNQQNNKL